MTRANPAPAGRELAAGAVPPLVSQLAFSLVSFFSIAGFSRRSDTVGLAALSAAYALESIVVASANARWTSLLVLKETLAARSGDVGYMGRWFAILSVAGVPVFGVAAFLVCHGVGDSLAIAIWCSAMLFGDVMRFCAARFLGIRPVATIAAGHAALGIAISFVGPRPEGGYLVSLAVVALVAGAVNFWVFLRRSSPGRSKVWETEQRFGTSLVVEAASITVAIGVGSFLISVLNPDMAVGLQLGNQVLIMPAVVVAQALGLPLSKRLRDHMNAGVYPQRLLAVWSAAILAIPVVAVGFFFVLRPLMFGLLGDRASLAYQYLPVAFLQMLIFLLWQPFTMARRWTHGPDSIRLHVVGTMAMYYGGLVVFAGVLHTPRRLFQLVVAFSCLTAATTVGRAATWWVQGRSWVVPRRALPPE